ncbi:MAG: transglutaminase family protein [Ilumatobacteraceae bacterium]
MQLDRLLDDDHASALTLDHRSVDLATAREATYVLRNDLTYEYPAPIRALRHRLVVVPRQRHGDQRRLLHRLHADVPAACSVERRRDRFGNPVVQLEAAVVPARISFAMRAIVHRSRDHGHERRWADWHSRPTDLTAADDDLRDAARRIEPHADGAGLATSICDAVHDAMTYEWGVTTVRTTAGDAWRGRRGVCQDMAHVMVAMCRARGLAARYVSGHLLGEGASHAWVEVHDERVGHAIAFDPTHGRRTDLRYVTVAVGRDYRDVAPTAGSYRAGPRGTLSVRKVVALADVR